MAPPQTSRKRKGSAPAAAEFSDEENDFNGDMLDGILSQGEDESDAESVASIDQEPDLEEVDGRGDPDELSDEHSDDESNPDGDDAANEANYRVVVDANGGERYEYSEIDPVYDSDDSDAKEPTNTIGNIPLTFYESYPHIGYDINGKKIMRPATGEALDALLDSIELPKGWTGLTDPQTGKPLNLSQDELELLRRLQMSEVPQEGYDPYPVRALVVVYSPQTWTLWLTGSRRTWFHTLPVSRRRCP